MKVLRPFTNNEDVLEFPPRNIKLFLLSNILHKNGNKTWGQYSYFITQGE